MKTERLAALWLVVVMGGDCLGEGKKVIVVCNILYFAKLKLNIKPIAAIINKRLKPQGGALEQ